MIRITRHGRESAQVDRLQSIRSDQKLYDPTSFSSGHQPSRHEEQDDAPCEGMRGGPAQRENDPEKTAGAIGPRHQSGVRTTRWAVSLKLRSAHFPAPVTTRDVNDAFSTSMNANRLLPVTW